MRKTLRDIQKHKNATPLVCLTAYSAPIAALLDAHADILLVGDSLGMVVYGMESTLPVTLPMMIAHGKAVVVGSSKALVVVDMPFGSYQASPAQAFEAAVSIMQQSGCQAVKLEGGAEMEETIAFLVKRGIPVMAHIGLKPQSVHADGGYRTHGKLKQELEAILADGAAVERAGAFAVVLEGVTERLAAQLTKQLRIPTIGIGASPACDGQVLVTDDMLGISARTPSFVKHYAELRENIAQAAADYASDVRERNFPSKEHCVE